MLEGPQVLLLLHYMSRLQADIPKTRGIGMSNDTSLIASTHSLAKCVGLSETPKMCIENLPQMLLDFLLKLYVGGQPQVLRQR